MRFWIREAVPHRPPPALYLTRARATKSPALLPPYTTGSVRIRSNLDIKLGRVIGGWQWRAADRRCASRCGHSSKRASGLGVAFVGALCRRIDSQGVDPRSLNWKISSPGKARNRSPAAKPCTTLGRPPVSPAFVGCGICRSIPADAWGASADSSRRHFGGLVPFHPLRRRMVPFDLAQWFLLALCRPSGHEATRTTAPG